jgi:hypothetical protein
MAEQNPYDGFLDFGGKAGRDWLAEFRADLKTILTVLNDWQATVRDIGYSAMDCNFSPGTQLEMPSCFLTLTSIVALWCDAELRIDPTPICDFHRRMDDFRGHNRLAPGLRGKVYLHRVPMTDAEIESCMAVAKQPFDRVLHATLARATAEQQVEAMKMFPATTTNGTRDKWLYYECCKVKSTLESIKRRLAKKTQWAAIDSIQGITLAANRYAKRNGLPLIPSRQPGPAAKRK